MNVVSQITGTGGGAGGTGFAAPSSANILNPATVGQANEQYQNAQDALAKQKQFVDALIAQGGLQNQNLVFSQLQDIAAGKGPNPAQAILNKATGQNVAGTTAAIAGARGAASNPGLASRTAAIAGTQAGQANAADAATMQANQSINAINTAGNLATQQANQAASGVNSLNQATQGEQGTVLNAITGQNNANVGMQYGINTANANLAGIRMGQQGNVIGNIMGGAGAAMGLAEGGKVPHYANGSLGVNNDFGIKPFTVAPMDISQPSQPISPDQPSTGPRSNAGKHLSGLTASNAKISANGGDGTAIAGNTIGYGIGKGLQAGWNALFGPSKAPTQDVSQADQNAQMFEANRPDMMEGTASAGGAADAMPSIPDAEMAADGGIIGQIAKAAPMIATMLAAQGGKVPAMLSPGERYLPPQEAKMAKAGKIDPMKAGVKVPGKPKIGGAKNDYTNDTVPATLEEGGLVLPRSVTQAKNPHWAAMRFVHAHMMANGGKVVLPTKKQKK